MHRFFAKNSINLASMEGCESMIDELSELYNSFQEADKIAQTMSKNIRKALGLSEEAVQEYVRSTIRKETGFDIDEVSNND